jgi:Family of unknown function (DUF6256)
MSSALLRQDFVPMVTGYVIVMATLGLGLRLARRSAPGRQAGRTAAPGVPDAGPDQRPSPRAGAEAAEAGPRQALRPPGGPPDWRRLARRVIGTMVGGYLLLMVVVILYYYLVARVGGAFIKSAFTGCAMLIGLAAPVWAAASWLTGRRRHRAAARPAHPEPR